MSDIIRKIGERINSSQGLALVDSSNDSTDIQTLKVSVDSNEVHDGIERIQNFGLTSNPPAESEAIVAFTGGSREDGVVIAVDSGEHRPKDLAVGESQFYSAFAGYIKSNADGTLSLSGDADFAVRFGPLVSGFNALRDHYNAHTHITTATIGSTTVPGVIAPVASPSTASIDGAKIDEIKTI